MGAIKPAGPVKLICGFIYREESRYDRARAVLCRRFGPHDLESAPLKFSYTDYYEPEMGTGLLRRFISFQRLITPDRLSGIKTFTNTLEKKLSSGRSRNVNIDPGYVDAAKLVLATTKDFSHRIYLGRGMYGEVTLMFRDKRFQPLEWTYPDYRTGEYLGIFTDVRMRYLSQIQERKS